MAPARRVVNAPAPPSAGERSYYRCRLAGKTSGLLMFEPRPVTNPSPIGGASPPAALAMLEPLQALLAPRAGERFLEVGAGNGCYTFAIAAALRPGGTVDIVDGHPELLAATMRGAGARHLDNIAPALGDPRYLPFEDATFDAAYLVAALGDMADQKAALHELQRVLRRAGRLAVGELHGDPHCVDPSTLAECAAATGLRVARRIDGELGYVALLERSGAPA
jgi:SAM-dependent methyltransferase